MNLNAAMRKLQRAILVRTGLVVKPVSQQGPEPYDYDVFTNNASAAGEPEGTMEDEGL